MIRGGEMMMITRFGESPKPRRSLTLLWVGLVFCSPSDPPTMGTKETWIYDIDCSREEKGREEKENIYKWIYQAKILWSHDKLKLAHSFNKGSALNITYRSSKLGRRKDQRKIGEEEKRKKRKKRRKKKREQERNYLYNTNIGCFASVWNHTYPPNPINDLCCNMGDNLNSFPQIISFSLMSTIFIIVIGNHYVQN